MKALTNKFLKPVMVIFLLLLTSSLIAQNKKQRRIIEDAAEAKTAFIEKNANLAELFKNSKGYAIFPNVGKGAYVVGGAAGNGAVYENGKVVGMAKLKQLDVGLQIGGQGFSQVILFQTESELNRFKKGNFELAATASAVILKEGVAESIEFRDGIAVVTMPKGGAMIEISVGGQKFNYKKLK